MVHRGPSWASGASQEPVVDCCRIVAALLPACSRLRAAGTNTGGEQAAGTACSVNKLHRGPVLELGLELELELELQLQANPYSSLQITDRGLKRGKVEGEPAAVQDIGVAWRGVEWRGGELRAVIPRRPWIRSRGPFVWFSISRAAQPAVILPSPLTPVSHPPSA